MKQKLDQIKWHKYFIKWLVISTIIGVVCGLSSIIFIAAIKAVTGLLLGTIAQYSPPTAGGEGGYTTPLSLGVPYLIPVVTTLGGLLSGLVVSRFAPEAEGVGTDAAIRAFHKEEAKIRPRVPIVKLFASALTIGSGGTSGREGPIAQIGAGAGSFIASTLKLDKKSRQIALAAGLGAGIASIFKAPLAGAIIGAEIFYTHDFEVEALIPGFIASVVGYSIVGYATGWQPVFSANVNPIEYRNPWSLPLYSILGVFCAGLALFTFRVYFPITRTFKTWRTPLYVKTAFGGLLTGLIGMMIPSVLGTGYGWVQIALDKSYGLFPPLLILAAIFAEIISLSFTLGSGGSGGIFGPSVVTGGLLGIATGLAFNTLFPSIAPNPTDFALVGMMAFFAADAKAPLSTIVLIAEMTGGYGLLAPSMFAVTPAFLLSGKQSVFPSQYPTRHDSPAHQEEFETLVLSRTTVEETMSKNVITVPTDASLATAYRIMQEHSLGGLPVVDASNRLAGIVTKGDVLKVPEAEREKQSVEAIMTRKVVVALPDDDLYSCLKKMTIKEIGRLPVVASDNSFKVIGIITRSDIGRIIETRSEPANASST